MQINYKNKFSANETLKSLLLELKSLLDDSSSKSVDMLITLVDYLEENPFDLVVDVYTAHLSLIFIQPHLRRRVSIRAWDNQYIVEYVLPSSEAHWSHGRVVDQVYNVSEASDMIIQAMERAAPFNQ